MMIPTRGASTSISSNASSTAGIVSGTSVSVSLTLSFLGRHLLDRPRRDVGAHLHAVELDPLSGIVSAIPRLGRRDAEGGHVQNPAAGGDRRAVSCVGARVGHLGDL